MKTAIVIGATGLVGSYLVTELINSDNYNKVVLLVRKKPDFVHHKIEAHVIDFENIDTELIKGDDLFCAIGTTIKKAGSKQHQYKIDCDYPVKIAQIAKQNHVKQFVLISSIGANANSSNFYLKTKGELEEKITALQFNLFAILRPSFILGKRNEFRLGEKIGIVFVKLLSPIFVGGLKKYKGVHAIDIAKKMLVLATSNLQGTLIIESDKICS
jgi:uncharacterized protein YbjT (DUF2867 family)